MTNSGPSVGVQQFPLDCGASESESEGSFSWVNVDVCSFSLIFYFWTDYIQFQINIIYVWFGKTYLWAILTIQMVRRAVDLCYWPVLWPWAGSGCWQLVIRAVDLCCDRELGLAVGSRWLELLTCVVIVSWVWLLAHDVDRDRFGGLVWIFCINIFFLSILVFSRKLLGPCVWGGMRIRS